jgi:regulator of sigma E protease
VSDFLVMVVSVSVVLGVMVLVHEWGHFIVAKSFHVRVEIFSIGFGTRHLESNGATQITA